MVKQSVLLFATVFAAVLAGCSRHAEPAAPPATPAAAAPAAAAAAAADAPAAAPVAAQERVDPAEQARKNDVMQAIFADRYDPAKGAALVHIPSGENAGYLLMTLVDAHDLADGRTVAIVNGATADDKGNDQSGHPSPGVMNVFVLRREGERWNVLERHMNASAIGAFGNIGTTQWIDLGPDKVGFIVLSTDTAFGQSITIAAIFELDHGVRDLGNFTAASSYDMCEPGTDKCWNVEGKIASAESTPPGPYRDIVVDFTDKRFGLVEDAKGDTVERVKSTTRQTVRYRFDGKGYVLAEGVNPAPDV